MKFDQWQTKHPDHIVINVWQNTGGSKYAYAYKTSFNSLWTYDNHLTSYRNCIRRMKRQFPKSYKTKEIKQEEKSVFFVSPKD